MIAIENPLNNIFNLPGSSDMMKQYIEKLQSIRANTNLASNDGCNMSAWRYTLWAKFKFILVRL